MWKYRWWKTSLEQALKQAEPLAKLPGSGVTWAASKATCQHDHNVVPKRVKTTEAWSRGEAEGRWFRRPAHFLLSSSSVQCSGFAHQEDTRKGKSGQPGTLGSLCPSWDLRKAVPRSLITGRTLFWQIHKKKILNQDTSGWFRVDYISFVGGNSKFGENRKELYHCLKSPKAENVF